MRLEFLAPARGRLVGRCTLDGEDLAATRELLTGQRPKVQLATAVTVLDAEEVVVCRGSFTWRLRRGAAASSSAARGAGAA